MKAKLKFETRPNLTRTGVHVTLGKEPSRTRPNLAHEIYIAGVVACKCEDNQYRPYRDCEHIRRFIAKLVPQTTPPYVSGTTRVALVDLSTAEPAPRPSEGPFSSVLINTRLADLEQRMAEIRNQLPARKKGRKG